MADFLASSLNVSLNANVSVCVVKLAPGLLTPSVCCFLQAYMVLPSIARSLNKCFFMPQLASQLLSLCCCFSQEHLPNSFLYQRIQWGAKMTHSQTVFFFKKTVKTVHIAFRGSGLINIFYRRGWSQRISSAHTRFSLDLSDSRSLNANTNLSPAPES